MTVRAASARAAMPCRRRAGSAPARSSCRWIGGCWDAVEGGGSLRQDTPRLRCIHLRQPDRLDIDELANAEAGKFATVAAFLDATEGNARIGVGHAVDEDTTALHPPCQRQ